MPANKANQCSDAENTRALRTSMPVEDDVKTTMSKSAQKIAQDRTNQNTVAGSGGKNPGASISKNVANNA